MYCKHSDCIFYQNSMDGCAKGVRTSEDCPRYRSRNALDFVPELCRGCEYLCREGKVLKCRKGRYIVGLADGRNKCERVRAEPLTFLMEDPVMPWHWTNIVYVSMLALLLLATLLAPLVKQSDIASMAAFGMAIAFPIVGSFIYGMHAVMPCWAATAMSGLVALMLLVMMWSESIFFALLVAAVFAVVSFVAEFLFGWIANVIFSVDRDPLLLCPSEVKALRRNRRNGVPLMDPDIPEVSGDYSRPEEEGATARPAFSAPSTPVCSAPDKTAAAEPQQPEKPAYREPVRKDGSNSDFTPRKRRAYNAPEQPEFADMDPYAALDMDWSAQDEPEVPAFSAPEQPGDDPRDA